MEEKEESGWTSLISFLAQPTTLLPSLPSFPFPLLPCLFSKKAPWPTNLGLGVFCRQLALIHPNGTLSPSFFISKRELRGKERERKEKKIKKKKEKGREQGYIIFLGVEPSHSRCGCQKKYKDSSVAPSTFLPYFLPARTHTAFSFSTPPIPPTHKPIFFFFFSFSAFRGGLKYFFLFLFLLF